MTKKVAAGVIDPDLTYTVEGAARELGVTPRWFRENFILSGELDAAARGHLVLFPGWVLCKWVERQCQSSPP